MSWSDAARRAAAEARRRKAGQRSASYEDPSTGGRHTLFQLKRPTSRGHRFKIRSEYPPEARHAKGHRLWSGTGEMGPDVKTFSQARRLFEGGAYGFKGLKRLKGKR